MQGARDLQAQLVQPIKGDAVDLKEAYRKFLSNKDYERAFEALKHLNPTRNAVAKFREKLTADLSLNPEYYYTLLCEAYDYTARESFDDFMVALEWNRENKAKFWLPRREKLLGVCHALEALEFGELMELFLSMPPRVGKSTLIMFFILWVMLRDPERSNLYSSYSDSVVKVFYNGLNEILQDPVTYRWREIFPERTIASTDAKDLLINIDRRKRYASFTGRSLYGTLNGACDCNGYEVADDLISGIEEAMNPDRLNGAWAKVDNNLLPRAKEGAKHLWIGTRWSISDPHARRLEMLENDEKFASVKWECVNVPALNEEDESNFDYKMGVGFSTEFYQQRRASFERNNDMASWLAQYQGEPIEREGAVFAPEDFTYYNGELPDADPDRIFMSIDPAWGGGDFTASPIIYQYGDQLYVHDVVYTDGDKRISQQDVITKAIKHNVQAISVEATKTTASYAEDIDQGLRSLGHRINVTCSTKHYTGNGKEQRIFDKAPDIREKMIFLGSGHRSKDYELFMQNVFSFKIIGKNKHDDAPDSLAQAVNFALFSVTPLTIRQRLF